MKNNFFLNSKPFVPKTFWGKPIKKKRRVFKKKPHTIYITARHKVYFGEEGKTWGIYGKKGTGKSYLATDLVLQHPWFIVMDPHDDLRQKVLEILYHGRKKGGFFIPSEKKEEFAHIKEPNYYKITPRKTDSNFKINISDINPFAITQAFDYDGNELAYGLLKKYFQRQQRDYDSFKAYCLEAGTVQLERIFDSIKDILHPEDKGIKLKDLHKSRTVIDYGEMGPTSPIPTLIIGTLFAHRRSNLVPRSPLLIGVDEVQENAIESMPLGKMMRRIYSEGRKMNLSGMMVGTDGVGVSKRIKKNTDSLFWFWTDDYFELTDKRGSYNIKIDDMDRNRFLVNPLEEKGHCFYYNLEAGKKKSEFSNAIRTKHFGLRKHHQTILDDFEDLPDFRPELL